MVKWKINELLSLIAMREEEKRNAKSKNIFLIVEQQHFFLPRVKPFFFRVYTEGTEYGLTSPRSKSDASSFPKKRTLSKGRRGLKRDYVLSRFSRALCVLYDGKN